MLGRVVIAGVLLLGCSKPAVAPATVTAPQIEAHPECMVSSKRLAFHVMIPIHYSKSSMGVHDARELYSWSCRRPEKTCDGAMLSMRGIDSARPIGFLDLAAVKEGQIVSDVGEVITIQWGPMRTFTVDLARGVVAYVESDGGTEGRGEAPCTVSRASL